MPTRYYNRTRIVLVGFNRFDYSVGSLAYVIFSFFKNIKRQHYNNVLEKFV